MAEQQHAEYPLLAMLDETIGQLKQYVTDERLLKPVVGIVCGSGLSTLAKEFKEPVVHVPYSKLKGFGESSIVGHSSSLAFGMVGEQNIPVVAMLGRFHLYEGHHSDVVGYPIRVMSKLGVKNIIITNAAGSLNPQIPVGKVVVVRDHLGMPNLTGLNPSFGPVRSPEYPRFLPLSDAYSPALRRLAFLAAHQLPKLGMDALVEGTYSWVAGPAYETPAEGRLLRSAGGDVVGMSTVPDVIAAREEKMNVLVLSLVTNMVVIPENYRDIRAEVEAELAGRPVKVEKIRAASHEEVLAVGGQKAEDMRGLVERIIELIAQQSP